MRYPFRSLPGSATLLLVAFAAPAAANAQIMTFAPVACATGTFNTVAPPYSESGFTLTAPGFGTWCADANAAGGGYAGPGLWISYAGYPATLMPSGGGTFSINAIELAHLYDGPWDAQSFTFTGNLSGGGTVSQTFTIGPQVQYAVFQPFLFDASWTNLVSVDFATQDYVYYQFTNVVLNSSTVPEPASMMLLGTGLVGVFGAARRRFSKTA